jgi:hypothetical protein
MKSLILLTVFFCVTQASAMIETKKLTTARGAELEVTVHAAAAPHSPTIVVAPGQSCNSKGPLFETLGKNGSLSGFTVIRFEWAYCLKDPAKPYPSPELKNEIEDYVTVLQYAKSLKTVDTNRITLAGKSLGSMVAYAVFHTELSAKALVLLTPVCTYKTDEAGKPLPEPMRVCEENYPELKKETRPVFMTLGDHDDLCISNVLFDYLKDSTGNIQVNIAGGDHGFRIMNADGSLNDTKTMKNIETVVNTVLNWVDLKVNP